MDDDITLFWDNTFLVIGTDNDLQVFRGDGFSDEITDPLEKLEIINRFLAASEKAEKEKQAFLEKMETVDHTSPKDDFEEKCRWLASQGRGNELAELLQARKLQK